MISAHMLDCHWPDLTYSLLRSWLAHKKKLFFAVSIWSRFSRGKFGYKFECLGPKIVTGLNIGSVRAGRRGAPTSDVEINFSVRCSSSRLQG